MIFRRQRPSYTVGTYGGIYSITREPIPWYARILGRAFALYALYKALRGRPLRFNWSKLPWRFAYSMDFDRLAWKVRHEFGDPQEWGPGGATVRGPHDG